jgi:hypothetical protein
LALGVLVNVMSEDLTMIEINRYLFGDIFTQSGEVGQSEMSSRSNLEQPNWGSKSALQKTTAIITLLAL